MSQVTLSYNTSVSTLNATLGISIMVFILVLLLYIIVACIILHLCGVLKFKREIIGSNVDNTRVYVPINELRV